MKVRVLGTRYVNFNNRDTGEIVKGTSVYVAYNDAQVNGECADKLFINDNAAFSAIVRDLKPGVLLDVDYTNKGRVSDVRIAPAATASAPAGK